MVSKVGCGMSKIPALKKGPLVVRLNGTPSMHWLDASLTWHGCVGRLQVFTRVEGLIFTFSFGELLLYKWFSVLSLSGEYAARWSFHAGLARVSGQVFDGRLRPSFTNENLASAYAELQLATAITSRL